ncbi:hypothetical protein GSI_05972 [Ganoderma sinense ZZ0214-1]|uniref:Uncharacterized protein n=1 Tax=Ganoderma sinense ZZ0214-1 TaxID=1077348 RepID=A0A2G8SBY7_9APHY|nr:hypothetical protein GSI_05972 [Ganoderma sinense ZZ0214-1]
MPAPAPRPGLQPSLALEDRDRLPHPRPAVPAPLVRADEPRVAERVRHAAQVPLLDARELDAPEHERGADRVDAAVLEVPAVALLGGVVQPCAQDAVRVCVCGRNEEGPVVAWVAGALRGVVVGREVDVMRHGHVADIVCDELEDGGCWGVSASAGGAGTSPWT